MFVSLNGYWPSHYTYRRYYWYPSHLYTWNGYHPVAYQMGGDTYNYYTYNNYDTGGGQVTDGYSNGNYATHETFADVRERQGAQQAASPDSEGLADTYFDAGMKAFENADYAKAAKQFGEAILLAPEDMILPYAYSQALFADGRFDDGAEVLRAALKNLQPEQEGIYYPRGLYMDEELLLEQIDNLAEQAELSPLNPDIQLLLGYHLLGIGEIDKSIEQLAEASQFEQNIDATVVLLRFASELKANTDGGNIN